MERFEKAQTAALHRKITLRQQKKEMKKIQIHQRPAETVEIKPPESQSVAPIPDQNRGGLSRMERSMPTIKEQKEAFEEMIRREAAELRV